MDRIVRFKDCRSIVVYEYSDHFSVTYNDAFSSYCTRGKVLYYSDENYRALSKLTSIVPGGLTKSTKSVFISKKSKISRDLVRKTYSIVRDKNKADCIVISLPKVVESRYHCAILDKETETLYLLSNTPKFLSLDRYDEQYSNERKNLFIDTVTNQLGLDKDKIDIIFQDLNQRQYCEFVSSCPETEELLSIDYYPTEGYIFDYDLPLNPAVNISPETLELWKRNNDMEMLDRLIVQSDWQKYPVTLLTFFIYEVPLRRYLTMHRTIMNYLKIKSEYNIDFQGIQTTPEDINMLKRYVLYKIGVNGDSGYVDFGTFCHLPCEYRSLLDYKVAVRMKPATKNNSLDGDGLSS